MISFTLVDPKKPIRVPVVKTSDSAGVDLYPSIEEDVEMLPGETHIFDTNLIVNFRKDYHYFGLLASRSGLGIKRGLVVAQGIGVIDRDYREELKIAIKNTSSEAQIITPDTAIAQLILVSYSQVDNIRFPKLEKARTGGLGSTN